MFELRAMSQELRRGSALLAACAALAGLGGCIIYNENHCAYVMQNGGADPCPADHVCNRCSPDNNGCVAIADLDSVAPQCLEGGGSTGTTNPTSTTQPTEATTMGSTSSSTGGSSTIADTETTTPATATETSDGTSTSTSTSTGSSTTGEPMCDPDQSLVDPDCAPPDPYCVGLGVCGACDELGGIGKSCSDVDPNKGVCDVSSGLCVQCTKMDTSACPAEMPGCDEATGQCAKCTEHRECPNTACDIEEGVCFPEDSVIYVKNDQAICIGGNGTKAKPFCNFQAALPTLMPGKKTTIRVIISGATAMQALALVNPGYILAIVSDDNQFPTLNGKLNSDSTIEVSTGSRVYVSHLRFQFSGSPSVLQCTGGTLYLNEVKIEGDGINAAKALDVSNCKTVIQRSKIFKNISGIQATGGSLSLENTHIAQNGTGGAAFGAFNLLGNVATRINYSSIALHPQTKSTSVFKCAMGIGQILIRNSAVVGLAPMQSAECTPVIKQELGVVQEVATAEEQTSLVDMWFDGLVDGALVAGMVSPLSDKAMWMDGDPRSDYEYNPRPLMSPGYAGADQRPQ